MLLIITCTEDVTCDMLIPFLDGMNVFRFNIDKWNEYIWGFVTEWESPYERKYKMCISSQGNVLKCN